jgi:hypothetical protein
MVDKADDLFDDNRVWEARHILAELVSEIRITTTSIPLGSFPVAIKKEAAALIDLGKTDETKVGFCSPTSLRPAPFFGIRPGVGSDTLGPVR